MTDRSKITRHPDVVAGEFQALVVRLNLVRLQLKELTDELKQVAAVADEMMRVQVRVTLEKKGD